MSIPQDCLIFLNLQSFAKKLQEINKKLRVFEVNAFDTPEQIRYVNF